VKPVSDQPVLQTWRSLLHERAILVDNIENLTSGIVSTIQVVEGHDPFAGRSGRDAVVVRSVVAQLSA